MPLFTSESSRALWEARWERLWELGRESELGPKGREYIEAQYGQEYWPVIEMDYDEWDFEIEY